MIDDPSTYEGLEKLFSTYKTNTILNTQQRREILICRMFFSNRAIQRSWENHAGVEDILNKYHASIYKRISLLADEQLKFEKLLNERYNDYFRIISAKEDDAMFQVGEYLMSKVFTNEKPSIIYITGTMNVINIQAETVRDFIRGVLGKFEVV